MEACARDIQPGTPCVRGPQPTHHDSKSGVPMRPTPAPTELAPSIRRKINKQGSNHKHTVNETIPHFVIYSANLFASLIDLPSPSTPKHRYHLHALNSFLLHFIQLTLSTRRSISLSVRRPRISALPVRPIPRYGNPDTTAMPVRASSYSYYPPFAHPLLLPPPPHLTHPLLSEQRFNPQRPRASNPPPARLYITDPSRNRRRSHRVRGPRHFCPPFQHLLWL